MDSTGQVALAVFLGGVAGAVVLGALAYGGLTLHAWIRERSGEQ